MTCKFVNLFIFIDLPPSSHLMWGQHNTSFSSILPYRLSICNPLLSLAFHPSFCGLPPYLFSSCFLWPILKSIIWLQVYNLGTGKGVSVKELVGVFERVTNAKVPIKYVERRNGDITAMWADASLARRELGWTTKHSVEEMCMYQPPLHNWPRRPFWSWGMPDRCSTISISGDIPSLTLSLRSVPHWLRTVTINHGE